MTSDNANRRLVVVAAIAASFLMLIFGLTYRVLEAGRVARRVARRARRAVLVNKTPIDPAALDRFPLRIGDWTGQDVPLNEAIVDVTGTDAHLYRRYSHSSGLESVSLYIGCGVNAYKVLNHRPLSCYIAAGFSLVDRRSMELLLDDGIKLPCSILQFFLGGLDMKKVTVLYYLIEDGQYFGDFSASIQQARHGIRVVGYVARVRIVASTESITDDSATRLVSTFAVDSALPIARLFEALEEDRSSSEFHEPLKGK